MRLAGWPQMVADKQLESRSWPAAELGDLLGLAACPLLLVSDTGQEQCCIAAAACAVEVSRELY